MWKETKHRWKKKAKQKRKENAHRRGKKNKHLIFLLSVGVKREILEPTFNTIINCLMKHNLSC